MTSAPETTGEAAARHRFEAAEILREHGFETHAAAIEKLLTDAEATGVATWKADAAVAQAVDAAVRILRDRPYAYARYLAAEVLALRPSPPADDEPPLPAGQSEIEALTSIAAGVLTAMERFVPINLCLNNPNVPDTTLVPLEVSMGELRAIAAAVAKAKGEAAPAETKGGDQ